jgi:hypothetical protein
MDNEYISNINYIRDPDPVITDRLIDDNSYNINIQSEVKDIDIDIEFENAIRESLKEYEEIQLQLKQNFTEEKEILNKMKPKLQKLVIYDKQNKSYYTIIIDIIEMYCNQLITFYSPNEMDYAIICFLLNKIRLTKEEKNLLHKIIVFN